MVNPLFVGLVSYVVRNQAGHGLAEFRELMLQRLQELHQAPIFASLDWYEDLRAHWQEAIAEDAIEDLLPEFSRLVIAVAPIALYWLCVDIRNSILLDDAPQLSYKVESFQATYTVTWTDGTCSDYCCRPVVRTGNVEFSPSFLYDLSQLFQQHIADYLYRPGLDVMHDQAAKPFDHDKFEELMKVLYQHINEKPAQEREAYEHVVRRLQHVLGKGPQVQFHAEKRPKLEWLKNGGGF